jgi:(E)-4-hydroxy-3-methylbut-2-enyl-diphosphate synthase
VPIVADIHFHYKRALEAADAGAACLRINPGNIGSEERVREVIAAARANGCAIRIGVNAGSLEKDLLEKYGEPCPEALVESALDHIRILEDHGFREYKVAVKASDVFLAVAAYMQLASEVDCPLHLGITGGGNGTHMVYLSGVTDHHVRDADMIDHIVKLVEAKAEELESAFDQPTLDAAE